MPAHWGLFDLAMHSWTEPAERVIEAAKTLGESINVVRPGGTYDIASAVLTDSGRLSMAKSTESRWSTEVTAGAPAPFAGPSMSSSKRPVQPPSLTSADHQFGGPAEISDSHSASQWEFL